MKKLKNTGAYAYLLPSFLIFGIFLFYPFFKTLYLSLFKTNKMGQAKLFVGLGNYKDLFQSSSFWNSLAVTLIFVVIVVAVSMILGLTTAILCNKTFPGIRFFNGDRIQFSSYGLQDHASSVRGNHQQDFPSGHQLGQ